MLWTPHRSRMSFCNSLLRLDSRTGPWPPSFRTSWSSKRRRTAQVAETEAPEVYSPWLRRSQLGMHRGRHMHRPSLRRTLEIRLWRRKRRGTRHRGGYCSLCTRHGCTHGSTRALARQVGALEENSRRSQYLTEFGRFCFIGAGAYGF